MDSKTYKTTAEAGWFVAGRRIPADATNANIPLAGFKINLTDAEAKYPLLNGEIEIEATIGDGQGHARAKPRRGDD